MAEKSRFFALDLLRGVAILLVLGRHNSLVIKSPADLQLWNPFDLLFSAGWAGVDIFFVLSGFLVSGLLFLEYRARGTVNVGRFLGRRAMRILPPYYFALIIVGGSSLILGGQGWTPKIFLEHLILIQNYTSLRGNFFQSWSLAVEEHFYLFLAGLFWIISVKPRVGKKILNRLPLLGMVLGVLVIGMRLRRSVVTPYHWEHYLAPTHLRFDSLLAGVVLAYYYHFQNRLFMTFAKEYRLALGIIGAAFFSVACVVGQESIFMRTYGVTLLYSGAAMGMVALLGCDFSKPSRVLKLLAAIGVNSYSIYLWHIPVVELVKWLGVSSQYYLASALYWVGSLLVGLLMARWIESPAIQARDKVFPAIQVAGRSS